MIIFWKRANKQRPIKLLLYGYLCGYDKLPLLWLSDKFLSLYVCFIKKCTTSQSSAVANNVPKKLLLCNTAHLGDVIISLSLVKAIKDYYPDIEIGFLAGSWCAVVLQNHPLISHTHYFDHWRISRAKFSFLKKWLIKTKTRSKTIKELKQVRYDAAIDLYHFLSNAIPLLWSAKIPKRYGYTSGGFGPLLTNPEPWVLQNKQIAYNHLVLVRKLLPNIPADISLQPILARTPTMQINKFGNLIAKKYILCHPSSGNVLRNWPLVNWIELKERLLQKKYFLVFTGRGINEHKFITQIIQNSPNCINLCNQLKWDELVEVVANAACTFSSDTAVSHITSAVNTASVVLIGGMVNYNQWQPLSKNTIIVHKNMPCLPCYRPLACDSIDCIRETTIDQVFTAIVAAFNANCNK